MANTAKNSTNEGAKDGAFPYTGRLRLLFGQTLFFLTTTFRLLLLFLALTLSLTFSLTLQFLFFTLTTQCFNGFGLALTFRFLFCFFL